MTQDEALRWLNQVDGSIFHNSEIDDENAWVAVVRTPAPRGSQTGKIILAFGETLSAAAAAAEDEWQTLWESFGATH